MLVYQRHLAREIYGDTLLVLAAFLGLFAFFDLIHELESVGRGGYEFHHALGFVALTLPGRAYEILPIAVLIGALYGLTRLAHHSEITVLRASGLSTGALLLTLASICTLEPTRNCPVSAVDWSLNVDSSGCVAGPNSLS